MCDHYLISEHFTIINFLRTDEEIEQRFNKYDDSNYKIKMVENLLHKIKLIRQIETTYNLNISTGIINGNTSNIQFDNDLHKLISSVF